MSGAVEEWKQAGFKWLFIFQDLQLLLALPSRSFAGQDTNFCCLHSGLVGLGVSVEEQFAMNSVCVPRQPGEAVG